MLGRFINQSPTTMFNVDAPVVMPSCRNYLHCLDCDETFDYWKYDSLADTDHDGHALRALTADECRAAALDCASFGCADE